MGRGLPPSHRLAAVKSDLSAANARGAASVPRHITAAASRHALPAREAALIARERVEALWARAGVTTAPFHSR